MNMRLFLIVCTLLCITSCVQERVSSHIEPEVLVTRTYEKPKPAPVLEIVPAAPLPKPAPKVEKKLKKTIVIDAGHGGKDTGTLSEKLGYEEKKLTLTTSRMVRNYLEELGYETVMTREYDTYVPLTSRAELANSLKAHLFVSIHYNHCPSVEADGVEIFYYKDEKNPKADRLVQSKKLGEIVMSRIVKHTGAYGRGIKTANFAVIRETKMPAILIEAGFLSNPSEREKIKDPQYLRYLAWGIAKGIDSYFDKK